jgi:uncharacterized protein (TIGR03067 family)
MMRIVPVAVLFLFTAVAGAADDAAAKKFLKELEGLYAPVSMTRSGEPAPDEFLKTVSFSIKGDTITVSFKKGDKGEDKEATIVVDPTQKPISIDMTPKEGPDAGKPMLGIIKVEKDNVTICWADRSDSTDRPKEFSSKKENKHFLIVMKKK